MACEVMVIEGLPSTVAVVAPAAGAAVIVVDAAEDVGDELTSNAEVGTHS